MQIQEQHQGAVTVLRPEGPVVGEDAGQLKQRFAAVVGKSLGRVVVERSVVPFVDSRALEALQETTAALAEGGQALRLCGTNETVREVLELTGLSSQFEYFQDVTAAVRSFM